jgi:hypothetical protein
VKRYALAALAVAMAVPSTAAAKPKPCGVEHRLSGGVVFMIRATNTSCTTATDVAGRWYNVQSHGTGKAPTVFDVKDRRWQCRITEKATGTDPGYNPYTSVRCSRRTSIVRFKLRS